VNEILLEMWPKFSLSFVSNYKYHLVSFFIPEIIFIISGVQKAPPFFPKTRTTKNDKNSKKKTHLNLKFSAAVINHE
jgi:hypothetical protein